MKRSEIAALLGLAAALERSGWEPTKTDVEAWHAIASESAWPSFEAARRALYVYRAEHPDFPIRPGHITQVLARVRAAASRADDPARERVPEEVMAAENFDQAYLAWIKGCAATHGQRYMAAFAAGTTPAPPALPAGSSS